MRPPATYRGSLPCRLGLCDSTVNMVGIMFGSSIIEGKRMKDDSSSLLSIVHDESSLAEERIRPYIRETPLEYSSYLSRLGQARVHLKLENLQLTGSFKLRGAMNKLLSLSAKERQKGVVTASSGNHGYAFAYLTEFFHFPGIIYLPETTSEAKIEALKEFGAQLVIQGDDCVRAEEAGRAAAAAKGLAYIPPYNDVQVMGGQSTVGIELTRQIPDIDTLLVPVGGGGLISGITAHFKTKDKECIIFGCQPQNSRVMYESIRAGHILDMRSLPTLSDGTAGGIEADSLTFPICRDFVDDFFLISETEIQESLQLILEKHHILAEGAAVLPVAAYLKHKERFKGKNVVMILSGNKLSLAALKEIL